MQDKEKKRPTLGLFSGGGGVGWGNPIFFGDIYIYAIHVPLLKLHKIDTYFSSWDKSR